MSQSLLRGDPRAKLPGVAGGVGLGTTIPIPFQQTMDTVGDGTGTTDGEGDHSITPRSLRVVAPASTVIRVTRVTMQLHDASVAFGMNGFGGVGAISPGIRMQHISGGDGTIEMFAEQLWTNNAHVQNAGFNWQPQTLGDTDWYTAVLDVAKVYGQPFYLDGDDAAELAFLINADLSAISFLEFYAAGYLER